MQLVQPLASVPAPERDRRFDVAPILAPAGTAPPGWTARCWTEPTSPPGLVMTLPSELQRPPAGATAATATAAAPAGRRDPAFAAAAGPPLWAGAVAALALLHAANPAAWGDRAPHLWVPAAGLGLCLVAWFGPRAAALVAVSQLLVV